MTTDTSQPTAATTSTRRAARWVWGGAILLLILHQDFWFWEQPDRVLGLLPIGLAYHVLYSLLAAGLWAAAMQFAWPTHLEAMGETTEVAEH